MTTYLMAAGIVALGLQAVLVIRLLKALKQVHALDSRVAHLGDALTLLSETTESGFRTMAAEIERGSRDRRPSEARTTTTRVASAARRGQSVQEIAATEAVSEGEVALRLHLAELSKKPALPTRRAAKKAAAASRPSRKSNGALRS